LNRELLVTSSLQPETLSLILAYITYLTLLGYLKLLVCLAGSPYATQWNTGIEASNPWISQAASRLLTIVQPETLRLILAYNYTPNYATKSKQKIPLRKRKNVSG